MPFWTEQDITPKLKDRFFVLINNELLITAKSVNKPELTFDNKEYKMINHHFKYPGLPKWNTVKITFVDMTGSGTEIATPSGTANLTAAEYLLGWPLQEDTLIQIKLVWYQSKIWLKL